MGATFEVGLGGSAGPSGFLGGTRSGCSAKVDEGIVKRWAGYNDRRTSEMGRTSIYPNPLPGSVSL
jgi:hypothetical protein